MIVENCQTSFHRYITGFQSINLIENDEFVSEDLAIAEVSNHYFTNITKKLEIRVNKAHL